MEQKLLDIIFIFIQTKQVSKNLSKGIKNLFGVLKRNFYTIMIFQNSSLTQKLHVHKEIWSLYIIVWIMELLVLEGTSKIICRKAVGGIRAYNIWVSKVASNIWLMKE